jgi:hypothetical protein
MLESRESLLLSHSSSFPPSYSVLRLENQCYGKEKSSSSLPKAIGVEYPFTGLISLHPTRRVETLASQDSPTPAMRSSSVPRRHLITLYTRDSWPKPLWHWIRRQTQIARHPRTIGTIVRGPIRGSGRTPPADPTCSYGDSCIPLFGEGQGPPRAHQHCDGLNRGVVVDGFGDPRPWRLAPPGGRWVPAIHR